MKSVDVNGKQYRLPEELNLFQQELYIHLIDWKWAHISKEPGISHGQEFDAILSESIVNNGLSPLLYEGIVEILDEHRELRQRARPVQRTVRRGREPPGEHFCDGPAERPGTSV